MYQAVRTTLCSAMRSRVVLLPYQAGMQPVKMLSMVLLQCFFVVLDGVHFHCTPILTWFSFHSSPFHPFDCHVYEVDLFVVDIMFASHLIHTTGQMPAYHQVTQSCTLEAYVHRHMFRILFYSFHLYILYCTVFQSMSLRHGSSQYLYNSINLPLDVCVLL